MNTLKYGLKTFLVVFMVVPKMKPAKQIAKPFLSMIAATLLLLTLSAFTFPPVSANAHSQMAPQHTGYKVLPGQEIIIPAPTKDDPKFTLHLKLSRNTPVPFSSLQSAKRAGVLLPADTNCIPVGEGWAGYNVFGGEVWSYSVSFTFCYDNTIVTYLSGMQPGVSQIIGWNVNHNEYSSEHKTWGDGGGNYTASSFLQSHSGFVQVNINGNGSYNGYGA